MIVFAVIVLILILIALIPVGVRAQYDHGAVLLQVAAGAIRLTLFPRNPVSPKKAARKDRRKQKKQAKLDQKREKLAQKKAAQPSEPEKPKEKILALSDIRPLLSMVSELVSGLPRKLLVRELTLHVSFGAKDAAQAAIGYGRAWAVIGGVTPVLENIFRIQNRDIDARLDYSKEKMELFVCLDLRMRIGTGFVLMLKAAYLFVRFLLQKKKKAVQVNESSSV